MNTDEVDEKEVIEKDIKTQAQKKHEVTLSMLKEYELMRWRIGSLKDDIKSKLSIVEVVSQYTRLEKRMDSYWGLCPFHKDKTPSLRVADDSDPYGGSYKCYACGASGDMFTFIENIEHVSRMEAVVILAGKAGIELADESGHQDGESNVSVEDVKEEK